MASQMAWMLRPACMTARSGRTMAARGAAFAQPAVKFAAGGGEHDGGSAAAELVSLRIGERRRGDQREPVPDDLIEPQAVAAEPGWGTVFRPGRRVCGI